MRPDAETIHRVHLIYPLHHTGLAFLHDVSRQRLVGLAYITVTIRRAAQHADLACLCAMSLAAARAFKNLRPLILGNHTLELHQQLILRAVALRRLYEQRLNALAC